jgi:hypothetical protein
VAVAVAVSKAVAVLVVIVHFLAKHLMLGKIIPSLLALEALEQHRLLEEQQVVTLYFLLTLLPEEAEAGVLVQMALDYLEVLAVAVEIQVPQEVLEIHLAQAHLKVTMVVAH